jgi:hypothetical protein
MAGNSASLSSSVKFTAIPLMVVYLQFGAAYHLVNCENMLEKAKRKKRNKKSAISVSFLEIVAYNPRND